MNLVYSIFNSTHSIAVAVEFSFQRCLLLVSMLAAKGKHSARSPETDLLCLHGYISLATVYRSFKSLSACMVLL
jgi:hypothetical protein